MKQINKKDILIPLGDYGYVLFEAIAKPNDNQAYSLILKKNFAFEVLGIIMRGVEDKSLYLKHEILVSLESLKSNIDDIIKLVKEDETNN